MSKNKWSDKDIKFFKDLIKSKIVEVTNDLEEEKKRADDIKTSTQSNAIYSSHMADASSDHVELEKAYYMIARNKTFSGYLDKALDMIENKTFGICQMCNQLINKDRLEEVPHTTKCFDCKNNR